jgi:hypothetical protein
MPKHVHCEMIKAWADGAKIQSRRNSAHIWLDVEKPAWYEDFEYRIKPKLLTYKIRLFIYRPYNSYYGHDFGYITTEEAELTWKKDTRFIRWITDWIEYEIEDVYLNQ